MIMKVNSNIVYVRVFPVIRLHYTPSVFPMMPTGNYIKAVELHKGIEAAGLSCIFC